jgi:hypothetical protein
MKIAFKFIESYLSISKQTKFELYIQWLFQISISPLPDFIIYWENKYDSSCISNFLPFKTISNKIHTLFSILYLYVTFILYFIFTFIDSLNTLINEFLYINKQMGRGLTFAHITI